MGTPLRTARMDTGQAEEIAGVLQERLASLIDLSLTLKHVHWNVVGSGFLAVHELMDSQRSRSGPGSWLTSALWRRSTRASRAGTEPPSHR